MVGKRSRRSARRKLKYRILIAALAAVFIFCAVKLIRYGISSATRKRSAQTLSAIFEENETDSEAAVPPPVVTETAEKRTEFHTIGTTVLSSAEKLREENHDLVGWLKIPGILSLPVVYRDNTFYLTHDFYGLPNDGGTVFLDVLHPLNTDTQYLFLHGHNMYDGSMFAEITHYRNIDFIRKHPTLTFTTLYERENYEIIGSLYLTPDELTGVAGLGRSSFASDDEFASFIDCLREHSLYFTKDAISPDTPLLALSTCYGDNRIVAVFQRIESK